VNVTIMAINSRNILQPTSPSVNQLEEQAKKSR